MLDAIIVIAQYARDQSVVSARDQAVSPCRMDHREQIFVWSLRRQARVGSPFCACQIIITALQVYKQVWAGLVCTACMHA